MPKLSQEVKTSLDEIQAWKDRQPQTVMTEALQAGINAARRWPSENASRIVGLLRMMERIKAETA